jgi:hypothetical protein
MRNVFLGCNFRLNALIECFVFFVMKSVYWHPCSFIGQFHSEEFRNKCSWFNVIKMMKRRRKTRVKHVAHSEEMKNA